MTEQTQKTTYRAFGADHDAVACKALCLPENYTIFMMSLDIDYVDDARQMFSEESDFMSAEEAADIVEEKTIRVTLPKGFMLVGLCPLDADEPRHYSVVDFSSLQKD